MTAENPTLETTTPAPEAEAPWQRLDPRMMLVRPVVDLIRALPVLIGAVLLGRSGSAWQWLPIGITALTVAISIGHCLTARYRVTAEQMEIRTGIIHRRHRSVPRDRIRTVDVTAEFKHRLFGLSAVKIGTGRHTKDRSDELILDAVSRVEAQRLATVLLHRIPATTQQGESDSAPAPAPTVLAQFDKRWIRYAPFTISGLAAVGAIAGFTYHFAHELRLDPTDFGPLRSLITYFTTTSPVMAIVQAGIGLLLLVSLTSVIGYILSFWNFTLTREHSALHIRRGLITTRSVSIEQDRLRGIQIREPLPIRLLGGARCDAVASGLPRGVGGSVLLPPAPADYVHQTIATALEEETDPTAVSLRQHPRRALTRRLTKSLGTVLVIAALLFAAAQLGIFPNWLWKITLLAVPIAGILAWDCYRNLGHALTERYVVSRKGSLERKTVALRKDGIIGWQLRRSFFQRRAGLLTLIVTVAAGNGGYSISDMAETEALQLADHAIPDLLTPFLLTRPAVTHK